MVAVQGLRQGGDEGDDGWQLISGGGGSGLITGRGGQTDKNRQEAKKMEEKKICCEMRTCLFNSMNPNMTVVTRDPPEITVINTR